MTTKQIAEQWCVSEKVVRDRAKIMPMATKNIRWDIPDVAMPPITSNMALVLLQLIDAYKKGGKPKLSIIGIRESDKDDGYQYLADVGYISEPSVQATITDMGMELLQRLSNEKSQTRLRASVDKNGPKVEVESFV